MLINLNSSVQQENREFEAECSRMGLSEAQMIGDKTAPLEREILRYPGELVTVITRSYENHGHGCEPRGYGDSVFYTFVERFSAGIITPEIRFSSDSGSLINVDNLTVGLTVNDHRTIYLSLSCSFPDIYFMERPPELPSNADSINQLNVEIDKKRGHLRKPRLELLMGDLESVPYLMKEMLPSEYIQFCEQTGRKDLATNDIAVGNFNSELRHFIRDVSSYERERERLVVECDAEVARLEEAASGDIANAFAHEGNIFQAEHRSNTRRGDLRRRIISLLGTGIQRGYLDMGDVNVVVGNNERSKIIIFKIYR